MAFTRGDFEALGCTVVLAVLFVVAAASAVAVAAVNQSRPVVTIE